jgi:glycosyltransferase involved in cell wall biosynthesis
MNIVFLTPYEQPTGQTSRNIDFAIRLARRGHNATIITNNFCHRKKVRFFPVRDKERYIESSFSGIRVIWVNSKEYYDNGLERGVNALSYLYITLSVWRRLGLAPHAIVADSVPPTAGILGWILARRTDAKFIHQIRDVWPIALVQDRAIGAGGLIYWVLRCIEIFLYKKSSTICSSLSGVATHVKNSGADPSKIVWIPNGVDLDKFNSANVKKMPNTHRTDSESASRFIIRYAGGYGNAHDVLSIVRAAEMLELRGYRLLFELFGDGPKRQECEVYCLEHKIGSVKFYDSVPRNEIPNLLISADLLVASVIDSDAYSFGVNLNKIYDYFASGRPIIFSGRALDDPVAKSGAGITVAPEQPVSLANAIESIVLLSPESRMKLGSCARQFAEAYFDVNKLADIYEEMLLQ